MTDLKLLSPPEKKVASKVLRNRGFSLRQIENILGVSDSSALLYSKLETPEELTQFQAELEKQFTIREDIVAAKALSRIDNKMATARINEALDVYKVMRGKEQGGGVMVNIKQEFQKEAEEYK